MFNKNFIVVGTPRSGTTYFCKVLADQPDIFIPKFPNYEPFNPHSLFLASSRFSTHLFDHNLLIEKLIEIKKKNNKEYFGFKTFMSFHTDLSEIIDKNQLTTIVILRKNFWKVLGSLMLAIDNDDYEGSSTKYSPFIFQDNPRERRRVLGFFNQLCKSYWICENQYPMKSTFLDKIYFEDLVSNSRSEKINNYFSRDLSFDYNYTDQDPETSYIGNFEEFKFFIKSHVSKSMFHYGSLPEYILEQFNI